MNKNASGTPLIVAALILGGSVVAASLLIQRSLDRVTSELGKVVAAISETQPAAREAAAPTPPGRPEPGERYSVDTEGSPRRGPEEAKVTVIEFADLQCPFCAHVDPTLERIRSEYGDQVSIVFKHLPLRMHRLAPAAHAAAEAAHRQGKFWEMHDLILANQRDLAPATFERYARQIGLDVERFRKDVASASVKKKVDADADEAQRLGVTGTPGFFINGRFISGAMPYDSFKRVIDQELKEAG